MGCFPCPTDGSQTNSPYKKEPFDKLTLHKKFKYCNPRQILRICVVCNFKRLYFEMKALGDMNV
jgi:hypothetical protein